MQERALPLDEQHLAPALDALEHELLGRAGDEVRDDGVDRDPPAGDRDPGLAGRDELASASPARCASRSSSSDTVIFPIAQSEPTVRIVVASCVRFAPVGTFSPGGAMRRSRSSIAVLARERRQLRIGRR